MFYKSAIHTKAQGFGGEMDSRFAKVVARLRQVLTASKGRHNDLAIEAKTRHGRFLSGFPYI